jgi:hypothetical protein
MSKLMIALFVTAGIGISGCATQGNVAAAKPAAQVAPISKDAYDAAIKNAEAQAKIDKAACESRTANAKDLCLAEANGKEAVAKADAEAAYKATPAARQNTRDARAQATYDVSKAKCNDVAGNAKDVCVKEADAVLVKAKADAKVDRVAADAQLDAAAKQAEARKDAAADKRNADYKVAIEKCDAFAGATKDTCISNAKLLYGK